MRINKSANKPLYDSDENGNIIISGYEIVPITCGKNSDLIMAYTLLWAKGWTTLSNPSDFRFDPINFGKCNDYEINMIKKCISKKSDLEIIIKSGSDIYDKSELEAKEVMIKYTGDICDDKLPYTLLRDLAYNIEVNLEPYPSGKKLDITTYIYKDGRIFNYKGELI